MDKYLKIILLLSATLILSQQQLNPTDPNDPCGIKRFCGKSIPFPDEASFYKFLSQYPDPIFQDAFPIPSAAPSAPSAAPSAPTARTPDFSQTNNQVKSVDEADLIKTDGRYIYTLSNGVLTILLAYPSSWETVKVVKVIDLPGLYPTDLFIEGVFLTIFGTRYEESSLIGGGGANPPLGISRPIFFFSRQKTFAHVYSIAYPPAAFPVRQYQFEGSYSFGRKTNGYVYLISNFASYFRPKQLPKYSIDGVSYNVSPQNIFYYPDKYNTPSFTSIFAFNLASPYTLNVGHIVLVLQYTHNLYMSENNIYLTNVRYFFNGISFNGQVTDIHKVYVNKLTLKPAADGQVSGYSNNQYWMDEYLGVFRIATTVDNFVTNNPTNGVYTFDKKLNLLGKADGVAPGERIFAMRFINNRGYMVTFRQVDPFFVIDLSVPTLPKFVGILKIPGFSRYLHPYNDKLIIGIGQDANANGIQSGLKISLFDVSNVAAPTQVASYISDQRYSGSIAEWESKAFLFSLAKNLLVIPGYFYNFPGPSFNGAFVFRITPTAINLRGLIDHSDNQEPNFYYSYVDRSLFINDWLYTRSQCKIRINNLIGTPDLAFIKDVAIVCQKAVV